MEGKRKLVDVQIVEGSMEELHKQVKKQKPEDIVATNVLNLPEMVLEGQHHLPQ